MITALLVVFFWVLIAAWPVTYLIYPASLLAIAHWRRVRSPSFDLPWPTVSIVVVAHNEEGSIERCVRACLAQTFPGGLPNVVVGLDGCTDGTAAVLGRIADTRLRVVAFERQGKAAIHNTLIPGSDAEVVATTDAGAEYLKGALEALVGPFRSSRVGCTSGVFAPRGTASGDSKAEATYFGFEYRLVRAESDLGILAKGSGQVQAFRRSMWRPIPVSSDADISVPSLMVVHGGIVRFVPGAMVIDDGPSDLKTVFRARRRMANQALSNVPGHIGQLVGHGYAGHAASLTLHKLLRWLAPLASAGALIASVALGVLGHWEYLLLLVAVTISGVAVLCALSVLRGHRLSLVAGFVVSQMAFLAAAVDCLLGARVTRWER